MLNFLFKVLMGISLGTGTAHAFEDPTGGKPFIPWLWEDQFKPTVGNALDSTGAMIFTGGALVSVAAFQYDTRIYEHNTRGENMLMDNSTAVALGNIGAGGLGLGIAAVQLVFDQQNGLMSSRAIAMTALTHITVAATFQRKRPGGKKGYLSFDSSFPSGHASSAFALAGSLGYAYGWKGGVPAYAVATAIALARVNENVHWLSDVVAGAGIGLFWARASYITKEQTSGKETVQWMPIPLPDGMMLSFTRNF